MKILLHSLNYSPELTGIGKYNGELCEELALRKHDVKAVVAPPYYPEWSIHPPYKKWFYKYENKHGVDIYRCPLYVPKKVTTFRRVIHLISFAISSLFILVKLVRYKPDVVIFIQPTLLCAPFTLLYCKLTGAKPIMHIQDFEVDAYIGLGLGNNKLFFKIIKKLENYITKKFDIVSTISRTMMQKVILKGVSKENVVFFPNWTDIEFVNPDISGERLKKEWGFDSKDKIVLYAGNVSLKQGLEIILEVAEKFRHEKNVKFVIVGNGTYLETLKEKSKKINSKNVFFKSLQPWGRVPEMLALADIHLIIQKKGAADAVLPSKLTNILSCGGHAIVTAERDTELGKIWAENRNIYQLIKPESAQELFSALSKELDKDLHVYNSVARNYAKKYLDFGNLISQFENNILIDGINQKKRHQ